MTTDISADTKVPDVTLHASCVAFGPKGVLIKGKSGAGKSSLAMGLIELGAVLVSDDLTRISVCDGKCIAHAPREMARELAGVIEARKIGLLHTPFQENASVCLIVDLDKDEPFRLPEKHVSQLLGTEVETVYKADIPHFALALKMLVTGGRMT